MLVRNFHSLKLNPELLLNNPRLVLCSFCAFTHVCCSDTVYCNCMDLVARVCEKCLSELRSVTFWQSFSRFLPQCTVYPPARRTQPSPRSRPRTTSRRTMTRKLPAVAAATPAKNGKEGCCFPRHKHTSWSAASGSRGTCQRRRGSTWPAWFASPQPKWRSGSRTTGIRWREPGLRKVWKWPISLLPGGWPCPS